MKELSFKMLWAGLTASLAGEVGSGKAAEKLVDNGGDLSRVRCGDESEAGVVVGVDNQIKRTEDEKAVSAEVRQAADVRQPQKSTPSLAGWRSRYLRAVDED